MKGPKGLHMRFIAVRKTGKRSGFVIYSNVPSSEERGETDVFPGCYCRRETREFLHPELLSSPLYPEYRFLSQSRIPCPNHWRIPLSRVAVLSRIPLMFPARTEIPRSRIPEIPFQTLLKRKKGKVTINVETVI